MTDENKARRVALSRFSSHELASELHRREHEAKEAAKNRSLLPLFRKIEQEFTGRTSKDKANFILSLPDEQQETLIEIGRDFYYLDRETEEERDARLSRTASGYWNTDQWSADFYENGKHIGTTNFESNPDSDVERWENDDGEFMNDVGLESFPGHATWHPSFADCWIPVRK